jgi:hypothetical protein
MASTIQEDPETFSFMLSLGVKWCVFLSKERKQQDHRDVFNEICIVLSCKKGLWRYKARIILDTIEVVGTPANADVHM